MLFLHEIAQYEDEFALSFPKYLFYDLGNIAERLMAKSQNMGQENPDGSFYVRGKFLTPSHHLLSSIEFLSCVSCV